MTSKLAIILLMCGAAWGQQADTTSCIRGKTCPGLVVYYSADCPKYQHLVPAHGRDCSTDYMACIEQVPDKCVDDLHTVTEREWQAMVDSIRLLTKLNDVQSARLKALESRK